MVMQQAAQTTGFNPGGSKAAGLAGGTAVGVGEAEMASFDAAQGSGVMTERKRVEAMVETLSSLRGKSETLAEVAHDARNMVTALGLYCDLLQEPGVLNPSFRHYGDELRLVATASRRLVEKLLALDTRADLMRNVSSAVSQNGTVGKELPGASQKGRARGWDLMPAEPISDLAAELRANSNLLSALAGPSSVFTLETEGGAQPVRLTGEDLTRILVNLVRNAAEAMPEGGSIRLALRERMAAIGTSEGVTLTVEDSGPGVPQWALEKIFDSGYTTRSSGSFLQGDKTTGHRGLGLSITRSLVEAAGGSIHAVNLVPSGARFEINLPVRSL
jgi:signal transduction histidine kinase